MAEVINNLRKEEKFTLAKLRRGIKKACLFLLRKSKEVVPVLTGALKGSGDVRIEDGPTWDTIEGIVFYTAEYAIYVHERLDLLHKEGKQAKFLEGPAKEHSVRIGEIIAEEVRKPQ